MSNEEATTPKLLWGPKVVLRDNHPLVVEHLKRRLRIPAHDSTTEAQAPRLVSITSGDQPNLPPKDDSHRHE